MAKFISSVFSDIRGSIAGTTYSNNKNGNYTRNRSKPTNRNTLAQQAARQIFGNVSSAWSGLSSAGKESFESMILQYPYIDSLGQTKYYTSKQLYGKLNTSLAMLGLPTLTTCPPPVPILQCSAIVMILAGTPNPNQFLIEQFQIGNGTGIVPVDYVVAVYATGVLGSGITSPKDNVFRYIGQFVNDDDMEGADLTPQYQSVYGNSWLADVGTNRSVFFGFKCISLTNGTGPTSLAQSQISLA